MMENPIPYTLEVQLKLFLSDVLTTDLNTIDENLLNKFLEVANSNENKVIELGKDDKITILNEFKNNIKEKKEQFVFLFKHEFMDINEFVSLYGILFFDMDNVRLIVTDLNMDDTDQNITCDTLYIDKNNNYKFYKKRKYII